ncbi:MAG TPA: ADYC domain-containing protein [Polyangiaceae bacterium]|nr:ADYC domain-containing protein [Polyangiaceae bacterium]
MSTIMFRPKLALCIAALTAACAAPDEGAPEGGAFDDGASPPVGERAQAAVASNGVVLNGVVLNGVVLNGVVLNGVVLNGVVLNGSALTGSAPDGSSYSGAGFIGAEFKALLAGGGTTPLFIDDARTADGVWFYRASFLDPATNARQPLCGVDAAGAPVEAIGLMGRWDYREGVPGGGSHIDDPGAFTFACRGAALAKCVELGYKPWASTGGVSLKNHHQACTRMLRADYCGDGTSHTVDGTPINLYDNVGVQADTQDWPFEAEWVPSGARFVSKSNKTRFKLTKDGKAPACFKNKVVDGTGDLKNFASGTLLMSEFDKKIAH